mmetsp:Transcript_49171/g.126907  ORF Transcript_49171/g.126907 Transcript_49171/m.126907 type:complete len:105 (-) Transcript_49171:80-394(-)
MCVEHGRYFAEAFLEQHFLPTFLEEFEAQNDPEFVDPVSKAHMHVQKLYRKSARFLLVPTTQKETFTARLEVDGISIAEGHGSTPREAKEDAASNYWETIAVDA